MGDIYIRAINALEEVLRNTNDIGYYYLSPKSKAEIRKTLHILGTKYATGKEPE